MPDPAARSSLLADPNAIAALGPRGLSPDVPVETRRELKRSPRFAALLRASEHCARLRHVAMNQRQVALAQMNERIEHKTVNGLGTKVGSIDSEIYFAMRAKYGDNCWDDPEFVKAFLRDNPACRIKVTRGTRGQEYGGKAGVFKARMEDGGLRIAGSTEPGPPSSILNPLSSSDPAPIGGSA